MPVDSAPCVVKIFHSLSTDSRRRRYLRVIRVSVREGTLLARQRGCVPDRRVCTAGACVHVCAHTMTGSGVSLYARARTRVQLRVILYAHARTRVQLRVNDAALLGPAAERALPFDAAARLALRLCRQGLRSP